MGVVLCATRGGQGSRAVRLAAIERAAHSKDALLFLYVVDLTQDEAVDEAMLKALRYESRWMGMALLNIARNHAQEAGVECQTELREGPVRREILAAAKEHQASVILLGASRDTSSTIFGDDAIEQFALELQQRTEVPVEIVHPTHSTQSPLP